MDSSHNGAYVSLGGDLAPTAVKREWKWRLPAYLASWLLLLGFLALQPLFENEPKLRVSVGALSGVAISFIIIGFLLSIIAVIFCKRWRERLDVICLPCLSSSFLGLLVILFSVGVSDRYDLGKPAGLGGAVVALLLSIVYLVGTIYSYYMVLPPSSPRTPGLQLGGLLHPSRPKVQRNLSKDSGEAPVHIIPAPPKSKEEEETTLQMSRLMARPSQADVGRERTSSSDRARGTYHIDWQQPAEAMTPAMPRATASPFATSAQPTPASAYPSGAFHAVSGSSRSIPARQSTYNSSSTSSNLPGRPTPPSAASTLPTHPALRASLTDLSDHGREYYDSEEDTEHTGTGTGSGLGGFGNNTSTRSAPAGLAAATPHQRQLG